MGRLGRNLVSKLSFYHLHTLYHRVLLYCEVLKQISKWGNPICEFKNPEWSFVLLLPDLFRIICRKFWSEKPKSMKCLKNLHRAVNYNSTPKAKAFALLTEDKILLKNSLLELCTPTLMLGNCLCVNRFQSNQPLSTWFEKFWFSILLAYPKLKSEGKREESTFLRE